MDEDDGDQDYGHTRGWAQDLIASGRLSVRAITRLTSLSEQETVRFLDGQQIPESQELQRLLTWLPILHFQDEVSADETLIAWIDLLDRNCLIDHTMLARYANVSTEIVDQCATDPASVLFEHRYRVCKAAAMLINYCRQINPDCLKLFPEDARR